MIQKLINVAVVISTAFFCAAANESGFSALKNEVADLLIKKDRRSAIEKIVTYRMGVEDRKISERARLLLKKVSETFLTELGQEQYQSGLSVEVRNPQKAQAHYEKALKLEKDHSKILLALIRLSLRSGDCKKSDDYINRLKKVDARSRSLQIIWWFQNHCLKKYKSVAPKIPNNMDSADRVYLHALRSLVLLELKKYEMSYISALEISKTWPDYPETYYILWKMASKTASKGLKWAKKYLELCDQDVNKLRMRYVLDPYICTRWTEVNKHVGKERKK